MEDVDMWRLEAGQANWGRVADLPADANLDGLVDGSDFLGVERSETPRRTHTGHTVISTRTVLWMERTLSFGNATQVYSVRRGGRIVAP